MSKMLIEVKTQFEGTHRWPEAPEEVEFLRNMHRHMFHVSLHIPVEHSDRDLEFIMVKRALDEFISKQYVHSNGCAALGRMSCEDVAWDISKWASSKYERGGILVSVTEDGENGCWVMDKDIGGRGGSQWPTWMP